MPKYFIGKLNMFAQTSLSTACQESNAGNWSSSTCSSTHILALLIQM